jgi:hypothetical protein
LATLRRTIVSSINPIETVWAQIKGYVASNKTFKSLEVKTLFVEGLRQVTAQNWQTTLVMFFDKRKTYNAIDIEEMQLEFVVIS